MSFDMGIEFCSAKENDIEYIYRSIHALAEEEGFPGKLKVSENDLRENLLGDDAIAKVLLAKMDGENAAFAMYYYTFSSTTGKKGLHLDDLYVLKKFRGLGIGRKMLSQLANIALEKNCARFEWWALRWNDNAIKFYKKLGIEEMNDLLIFRAAGTRLNRLAHQKI